MSHRGWLGLARWTRSVLMRPFRALVRGWIRWAIGAVTVWGRAALAVFARSFWAWLWRPSQPRARWSPSSSFCCTTRLQKASTPGIAGSHWRIARLERAVEGVMICHNDPRACRTPCRAGCCCKVRLQPAILLSARLESQHPRRCYKMHWAAIHGPV